MEIMPGDRVKVFDGRIYKNDRETPDCFKQATVVCRYGCQFPSICTPEKIKTMSEFFVNLPWNYDDVIDVIFDHRPDEISRGHFTENARRISNENK